MRAIRILIGAASAGVIVVGSSVAFGGGGALADGKPPLLGVEHFCVPVGSDFVCYTDHDLGYEKAGVFIYGSNPNYPGAPVVLGAGVECDHLGGGATASHVFLEPGTTKIPIPIFPVSCK